MRDEDNLIGRWNDVGGFKIIWSLNKMSGMNWWEKSSMLEIKDKLKIMSRFSA